MLQILSRSLADLSMVENMIDLKAAIALVVRDLGFVSFNITIDKRHAAEFIEDPLLTTWAPEAMLSYLRDGWAERDPNLQSAIKETAPFLWSAEGWRDKGHAEYAAFLELSGIRGGATIPLGNKPGQLGAMSLLSDTDRPLTADALHAASILANCLKSRLQLLRVTGSRRDGDPDLLRALSGRQIEILHWVAAGKTNREIAVILESTQSTINYHLEQIRLKLGVPNRTSAATLYRQAVGRLPS